MAENNWSLLDGRSLLVEFDPAQPAGSWSLNDGRSFDVAFAAPATPWAEWDWLCGGGMIQAADSGGGSIAINLSDSATGSDSASLIADVSQSDSGSGSDAAAAPATIPAADSAAGADAAAAQAAIPTQDSAAGSDSAGVAATISLSDTAAGADDLVALAAPVYADLTDAATGSDAGGVLAYSPSSDTASGSDGMVVDVVGGSVAVDLSDSATGSDALLAEFPQYTVAAGGSLIRLRPRSGKVPSRISPEVVIPAEQDQDDRAAGDDSIGVVAEARMFGSAKGASGLQVEILYNSNKLSHNRARIAAALLLAA